MPSPSHPPKLLDQVRATLRRKHYSYRTETTYVGWIKWVIHFHGMQHPRTLGEPEIVAFLSYLAVEEQVAASTQNQALSALLFLYRDVLERELHLTLSAGQYMFPAERSARDPRSGVIRRHHVPERSLQHAVRLAAQQSGVPKCITCHTFRHSFATHLL